jgi:hypothetical protein
VAADFAIRLWIGHEMLEGGGGMPVSETGEMRGGRCSSENAGSGSGGEDSVIAQVVM